MVASRARLAGRRRHRSSDDPGAACRAPRPARPRRTGCARARLGRGAHVPPRRRAGALARTRPSSSTPLTALVRQGAAAPRSSAQFPGRGRVSLPPPADPRRGLRRAPEIDAGRAARALRRPGSASAAPTSSRWTRSSATTSSGRTATASSSGLRTRRPSRSPTVAAERLAAAGTKAAARGDVRAATSLLARALALYPADDARRLGLLPTLGSALREDGQWDVRTRCSPRPSRAGRAGDRRVAADGAVALIDLRLLQGLHDESRAVRSELAEPACVFEELGDEAGLARALGLAGQLRFWAGEVTTAIEELERAARHAHAAGDRMQEIRMSSIGAARSHARPHARRVGPRARRADPRPVGGRSRRPR